MNRCSITQRLMLWSWLLGLAGLAFATSSCTGPTLNSSTSEQPLETSLDHHGVQFDTTTSRPIPFSLAPGSKLGLLHDDRDEGERQVRVTLEQAVFSLKASIPSLIVVERRSVDDLQQEFTFQARGLVKDQDLAKVGHFLGLDYVVVFDLIYQDLNELYGLRNQIDTWDVVLPLKIIAVNTAEVKLHCLATVKAKVGRQMKASEVRLLNQEALSVAATLASQCLSSSLTDAAPHL
jgi:hypothetical protein